jgi:hypothetical protein
VPEGNRLPLSLAGIAVRPVHCPPRATLSEDRGMSETPYREGKLERMNTNAEVEAWFESTKRPAEAALRRVRDIILAGDPRMTETVKYGTVQFASDAPMAGFVQHAKKSVTLMFNRGQLIKGDFPHLEGDGPNARFMRFADLAEVDGRAAELTRIVIAWCDRDTAGR